MASTSCVKNLPAVPMSAKRDLPTRLRGFELGAVDYLAKSFSIAELLARTDLRPAAHQIERQLTTPTVAPLPATRPRRMST